MTGVKTVIHDLSKRSDLQNKTAHMAYLDYRDVFESSTDTVVNGYPCVCTLSLLRRLG